MAIGPTNDDVKRSEQVADNTERTARAQESINSSITRAVDRVKTYNDEIQKAGKESGEISAAFKNASTDVNNLGKSLSKLANFNKKDLKDRKKRQGIVKDLANAEQKRAQILNRIEANNVMIANAVGAEKEAYEAINKELFNSIDTADGVLLKFEAIREEIERIDKGSNFVNKLADGVKDIPGLGPLLAGPLTDLGKGIDAVNVGFFEAITSAEDMANLTGGLMKSAFIFIAKSVFDTNKSTVELSKQLGVSEREGNKLAQHFDQISRASGDSTLNAQKLVKAQIELGNTLGAVTGFTDEQVIMQSKLVNLLGMEADEAAKLTKFSISQEKPARQLTEEILDQVAALEKQTGIRLDGRKVISEVLSISGALSASYDYQTGALAKAVVQANKLGLSLKDAEGISRNLLDFEQSIEAEMAAELITGRNLELSRARSLALEGKSAEAVAELARQFGTAEEFSKLNVLAREDLAAALGMEADQLADSIKQQEILTRLGVNSLAQLEKEGRLEELNNSERGKQLLKQYEAQAAADKFADAMANVQSAVGQIVNNFAPVIDIIAQVTSSAGALKGILLGIGAVSFAGTLAKLATMFVSLSANAAVALSAASAITLGVGMVAVIAGIAAGMSAVSKAKNQAKSESINDGVISPDGNIISTNPADFLIATKDPAGLAGGVSGGDNSKEIKRSNQLLEALLNKEASVTLSGQDIGTATAVTSYSLQ